MAEDTEKMRRAYQALSDEQLASTNTAHLTSTERLFYFAEHSRRGKLKSAIGPKKIGVRTLLVALALLGASIGGLAAAELSGSNAPLNALGAAIGSVVAMGLGLLATKRNAHRT